MKKRHKQYGFTLIEAMVSIGVLAGVVAVATGSLQLSLRSASVISRESQSHETLAAAIEVVRSRLQSNVFIGSLGRRGVLRGDGQSLSFMHYDLAKEDVALIEFDISSNANTSELSASLWAAPDFKKPYSLAVLFHQSEPMSFEYFGSANEGAVPTWHPNWASREPPERVAIVITMRARALRFEMTPGARSLAQCAFDAVARRCRATYD